MARLSKRLRSTLAFAGMLAWCALTAWALPPENPAHSGWGITDRTEFEGVDDAAETSDVPTAVNQPYFDLDAYLDNGGSRHGDWHWQLLPNDLIYKSYLAGMKESRSGTTVTHIRNDSWLWEGVLGARVGMLAFGDHDPLFPQGFQIDVEGAANVRLDVDT